jgi:aspartate racemase
MLHLGIVGCSAEGAALCYRTFCLEGERFLGPHAHPEVSMHTSSLAEYTACLERGRIDGVAALMLRSAHKLAAAGAELLICPDNTIHQAMPLVLPSSPLPWLHIAEVVADEAAARGFRRIGITGTRWLVDSEVYPSALAARELEWRRPPTAARDFLQHAIMDELVRGVVAPSSVAALQQIISALKDDDGCDAVVLGCTELPLALGEHNSPLPPLDSTRLLARAALGAAVSRTE